MRRRFYPKIHCGSQTGRIDTFDSQYLKLPKISPKLNSSNEAKQRMSDHLPNGIMPYSIYESSNKAADNENVDAKLIQISKNVSTQTNSGLLSTASQTLAPFKEPFDLSLINKQESVCAQSDDQPTANMDWTLRELDVNRAQKNQAFIVLQDQIKQIVAERDKLVVELERVKRDFNVLVNLLLLSQRICYGEDRQLKTYYQQTSNLINNQTPLQDQQNRPIDMSTLARHSTENGIEDQRRHRVDEWSRQQQQQQITTSLPYSTVDIKRADQYEGHCQADVNSNNHSTNIHFPVDTATTNYCIITPNDMITGHEGDPTTDVNNNHTYLDGGTHYRLKHNTKTSHCGDDTPTRIVRRGDDNQDTNRQSLKGSRQDTKLPYSTVRSTADFGHRTNLESEQSAVPDTSQLSTNWYNDCDKVKRRLVCQFNKHLTESTSTADFGHQTNLGSEHSAVLDTGQLSTNRCSDCDKVKQRLARQFNKHLSVVKQKHGKIIQSLKETAMADRARLLIVQHDRRCQDLTDKLSINSFVSQPSS